MRDYDWDDRWEPGYDAGPECDHDCDNCGRAVMERELTDDGCVHCDRDDDGDDETSGIHFADPGGRSALRAASASNPRDLPCPNCGAPNVLTPQDRALGYQCDRCADQAERGGY
jgi:ribosomal protein L37AE/L43A